MYKNNTQKKVKSHSTYTEIKYNILTKYERKNHFFKLINYHLLFYACLSDSHTQTSDKSL